MITLGRYNVKVGWALHNRHARPAHSLADGRMRKTRMHAVRGIGVVGKPWLCVAENKSPRISFEQIKIKIGMEGLFEREPRLLFGEHPQFSRMPRRKKGEMPCQPQP